MWITGTLVLFRERVYSKNQQQVKLVKKGNTIMSTLSDELLVESYYKAVELDLEMEFIHLLLAEIHKRQLPVSL